MSSVQHPIEAGAAPDNSVKTPPNNSESHSAGQTCLVLSRSRVENLCRIAAVAWCFRRLSAGFLVKAETLPPGSRTIGSEEHRRRDRGVADPSGSIPPTSGKPELSNAVRIEHTTRRPTIRAELTPHVESLHSHGNPTHGLGFGASSFERMTRSI